MQPTRWNGRTLFQIVASVSALLTTGLFLEAAIAWANGGCCCHCGCPEYVQKMCRVVCETKEIKHTRYKVLCEDYCLPKVGHFCGCEYIPECGHVRCRKRLVKFEEVEKVPVYKCVVEYLCPHCTKQYDAQPYEEPAKQVPHMAKLPETLSRLVRAPEVPPVETVPAEEPTITR